MLSQPVQGNSPVQHEMLFRCFCHMFKINVLLNGEILIVSFIGEIISKCHCSVFSRLVITELLF